MPHRKNNRRSKKDIGIFLLLAVIVIESAFIFFLFRKTTPVKEEKKVERKIEKKAAKKQEPKVKSKGKIVIVLDDWGYNSNNFTYIKQIKYPLTLAILPNLPYSRKAAIEAKKNNKEVILHMPLEPHKRDEYIGIESNTITTDMAKPKIKKLLNDSIKSIPYLKGISNHMGSKATENNALMGIIFEELKRQNLFFLDSLVTDKSICKDLASKIKLGFYERDIFLDNRQDYEYIRGQLKQLVDAARSKGKAIGIGHDRKVTLEVLEDEMPKIEKEGFTFVFLLDIK